MLAHKDGACEHVRAVLQHLAQSPDCAPELGLPLTGFLAFVHHGMTMPKRQCPHQECQLNDISATTSPATECSAAESVAIDPSNCVDDDVTVDDIMNASKPQLRRRALR